MPLKGYGVWRCTPTAWNPRQTPDHGHITFTDGSGRDFDSAVNVMSRSADTRLVYWLVRNFDTSLSLTTKLEALALGFHAIDGPNGLALDFLRGNLINLQEGIILSHDGSENDIIGYLSPILDQAVNSQADMYLFGQQYFPGKDGIHDIHMNQGSIDTINPKTGRMTNFKKDNGTWQDGGIIIHFPDGHWEAIFLAFASQASTTDDEGQPIGKPWSEILPFVGLDGDDAEHDNGTVEGSSDAVSIEAALINPTGPDQQPSAEAGETVFLLNKSAEPVSLAAWSIANRVGQQQMLAGSASIPALSKQGFLVPECPLSNKGGDILLKDAKGKVVQKVSYSKEQATREGKLVYFGERAQQLRSSKQ